MQLQEKMQDTHACGACAGGGGGNAVVVNEGAATETEVPLELVAFTEQVYAVPACSPVTPAAPVVQDRLEPAPVQMEAGKV